MNKIDFYASEQHYFDHIYPIWKELPIENRGTFFVSEKISTDCIETKIGFPSNNITLVSSYSDYKMTKKQVIYMEHGIGNTYSNDSPYYAGGFGKDRVVLFLNNHILTQNKNIKTYPKVKGVIIGTPKCDQIKEKHTDNKQYVICFSFHWDCDVVPETKSAFSFYKDEVIKLSKNKDFKVIFHGHPRNETVWNKFCLENNIERVKNIEEVFERSDLYICDNSSSIYEFILTSKPVIVLNAPWYRKWINHGIRFWNYIPGPQVNHPNELLNTINKMTQNPKDWLDERNKVIKILYPNLGTASKVAAEEIVKFLKEK